MECFIRFATKADTESIMLFIDQYWRKNHILARDKELFEWQYGGDSDRLNIVIGLDDEGTIQGMLGFVPYAETKNKDIALALWKANPSTGFLGVKLIRYLIEEEPHREIVCPGINLKTTAKIYEYIGMHVGTMTQWYRLAKRDSYVVAKVVDYEIPVCLIPEKNISFEVISDVKSMKDCIDYNLDNSFNEGVPFKSIPYITKRYFEHPRYKYIPYGVRNPNDHSSTILFTRIQECNGSQILRLIDCIGNINNLRYITEELDRLLVRTNCEYIDCYEAGIEDSVMEEAGWKKVEEGGNVIPNYFSPFEHRKVDIHYSTSSFAAVLFKGDGDQDRPN